MLISGALLCEMAGALAMRFFFATLIGQTLATVLFLLVLAA
ncbi:hypothetical protein B4168_4014 [Anoxybacillus flavithermus]|nr:hypothetical protein B4168_4014 [Anoxybacillus flavithermus]OAO87608.1 hypothetical protein GT23_1257 [Parageobacillus thermoglucosidasius]